MTRESCIPHPPKEPLIVIRKWQVTACDGNHCAAALLSHLEYWHNIKLEEQPKEARQRKIAEQHGDTPSPGLGLLQFHNEQELIDGMVGLFKRDSIRKALKLLESKNFISLHKNPSDRYKFDQTRYFLFHEQDVKDWLNGYDPVTGHHRKTDDGKRKTDDGKRNFDIDPYSSEITSRNYKTKTTKCNNVFSDENDSHSQIPENENTDPNLNTANAVRISSNEISLDRHEEKTSTSSTGDKDFSTKARRTQKPEEPNRTPKSPTSLKDQKQATHGSKSIGEDKKRGDFSPKKEKEKYWGWIGDGIYDFDERGVVVLPSDGANKLPRALALKRMQIWLYKQMEYDAACELARVGNEVWGRDEKDTDWAELKPVGQMLSYAEKYYEARLIDDFNIAAVEALKTAQAWCAEFGSKAPVMAQKLGVAEIFGLDWIEELEDEDDDAGEAVDLEDEYDVIPF